MMIDSKSLRVVLKVTENLDGCDLDELRMLVSHDLCKEVESENAECIKWCLLRRCNIYTVCVKNSISGETSIVRRRFSDFYRLRQKLLKLVPCKRESCCSSFIKQISKSPFPRRRLFRSRYAFVVSQRVDLLERFVRHVLSCYLVGNFRMCADTAQSVHDYYIRSFLEIDDIDKFCREESMLEAVPTGQRKRTTEKHTPSFWPKSFIPFEHSYESQPDTSKPDPHEHDKFPKYFYMAMEFCPTCVRKWLRCHCAMEKSSVQKSKVRPQ